MESTWRGVNDEEVMSRMVFVVESSSVGSSCGRCRELTVGEEMEGSKGRWAAGSSVVIVCL